MVTMLQTVNNVVRLWIQLHSFHRVEIFLQEEFEDSKGVIRICISKKNKQHNCQKKKYKRTNNDLQNIHIKLKIE